MTTIEAILIMLACFLNVFIVAEYEGSNLKVLNARKMAAVIFIFFALQGLSYIAGYGLAQLPLDSTPSEDMKRLTYGLAGAICLIIGIYMLYRFLKHEPLEERLREVSYRRFGLEALTVALYTFACGIVSGFIGHSLWFGFVIVSCATILAVVTGLYTGYSQGYRVRKLGFGIICATFLAAGCEVLIRYL